MLSIEDIKNSHKVVTDVKVRYMDLDTLRHVNNSRYLSFLEEARIEYIEVVNGFQKYTLDFGVVVARIEIDYLYPITISDEVKVYTKCTRIGNKSFTFNCIFIINDAKIAANSNAVIVAVNEKGETVQIADEWRKKVEEFEG